MPPAIFDRVIEDVRRFKIQRVKLIGGEPTQHPHFPSMIGRLARATKYLQLVTNAQWRTQEIPEAIIDAPVNLIEISIDAGGKEIFEASRLRGSYDRVLSNLQLLSKLKDRSKGKSTLNVRLMIRPSTKHHLASDTQFYKRWADTVMPQNLLEVSGLDNKVDVFTPLHVSEQTAPRCSHPFKCLEVKWDGSIPLCGPNAYAAREKRIELGNIHTTTLGSAWNSPELKTYRHAHRWRKNEDMPACQGCKGV